MTLTPELQAELRTLVQRELEQRDRERSSSRTMYQRVCREFEAELAPYEYDDPWSAVRRDGTVASRTDHIDMRPNVRYAIGTLLKAVYRVTRADKIPGDMEPRVREFVRSVLDLMASQRREDSESA